MEIGFGNMLDRNQLAKIKETALENNIPIMVDATAIYLQEMIRKNKVHHILEIGSAVGYSAIMMCDGEDVTVTTIEKDEGRYLEAVKNVEKMNLQERIHLLHADALEIELDELYDLIFIDAAKAQNKKFFEHFSKNLKPNGVIVTDNMKFHGLVEQELEEIESKNLRQMIRKIHDYISFLQNHPDYVTEFLDIGDGLAVSRRK